MDKHTAINFLNQQIIGINKYILDSKGLDIPRVKLDELLLRQYGFCELLKLLNNDLKGSH